MANLLNTTECAEGGEGMEGCSSNVTDNGLHHFQYSHSQVVRKVKRHLEETYFNGITVELLLKVASNINLKH